MSLKMSQLVHSDLFFWNIKANSDYEVISHLAEKMNQKGFVNEYFRDSVMQREKQYPTGLLTKTIGVAIPHTDVNYVQKNAIGIAVLENPVEFCMMGIPESKVDVKMVFLLALTQPHGHLDILKQLTEIFESDSLLPDLVTAKNGDEAYKKWQDYFVRTEGEG